MSKRVLNKCWGNSIEKLFCPVFHGGSSLRNVFKKIKKFSKFQKRPKSFPKCPNVSWTSVGVILSKNYFAQCCMEGRVFEMFLKKYKKFQNSKNAQNRTQTFQKCFGVLFGKNFICPVFDGGSSLRNVFRKSKKNSKFQKRPKLLPDCPKVLWTCFGLIFSIKYFCPVFHGGSSLRNVLKKSKIFKIAKKPKVVPKSVQTCFEHVLG